LLAVASRAESERSLNLVRMLREGEGEEGEKESENGGTRSSSSKRMKRYTPDYLLKQINFINNYVGHGAIIIIAAAAVSVLVSECAFGGEDYYSFFGQHGKGNAINNCH